MSYKIADIPFTEEYRKTHDALHYRTEYKVRVESPTAFRVYVRRVNVSSRAFLAGTPKIVRFSESQYAIPNSRNIRLRAAAYYRDWEESDGCGIGDAEEATFRRETDFATFQREAGQIPISGARHIQLTLTHRKECWVLCTAMAPWSVTRLDGMRANVCRGYDAATLIEDPSEFARQLGIDFGNALRTSDLESPGPIWWTFRPEVFVDHGPVVYTASPSDVIQRFPQASWELVTPFVKRAHFSHQKEYRFVVSIGGRGDPRQKSLDLSITEELRALTRLI
ncbi:MAG: hypothetical protein F4W95_15325 [Chloroflexi bacterium]|nr:hypothetical protein [Chloroflexota bacterium]MYD49828.1 hypothetical protein [Chloroflexota bacterium]